MSILTNWIFWIIVSAIVLLLAIVGYLSESRKKSENVLNSENNISNDSKDITSSNSSDINNQATDVSSNGTVSLDDWSVMPDVSPISNGSVDPIVEQPVSAPVVEQTISSPVEQAPVVEQTISAPVEQAPVVEQTISSPVEQAPVVEQTISAPVEQAPVVEQPVSAPVEQAPVVEPSIQTSFIEPNSVFNSSIDQVASNPVPIPAEPTSVAPTPIPSDFNVASNPQPQSGIKNDIETL